MPMIPSGKAVASEAAVTRPPSLASLATLTKGRVNTRRKAELRGRPANNKKGRPGSDESSRRAGRYGLWRFCCLRWRMVIGFPGSILDGGYSPSLEVHALGSGIPPNRRWRQRAILSVSALSGTSAGAYFDCNGRQSSTAGVIR